MNPRYFLLLSLLSQMGAQTTSAGVAGGSSTVLRDLSAGLDQLSRKADQCVVQIFATSYALNEDGISSKINLLARQRSSGSGAVLSEDGFIITNSHVVQGAKRVQVQFTASDDEGVAHPEIPRRQSGRQIEARIVGYDRESDLAVLKVERSHLPYLRLGDSDQIHKGQLVLAFGHQLRPENSRHAVKSDAPTGHCTG